MDCFIHQSYGRVRIRVPALKDASERSRALMKALSELKGVRKITVSDITGSVIIHYDPTRQEVASILKIFHSQRLLTNVVGFPRSSHFFPQSRPQSSVPAALGARRDQAQALPVDAWLSAAVQQAGKVIFLNLVEAALTRTSRLLMRRIFT